MNLHICNREIIAMPGCWQANPGVSFPKSLHQPVVLPVFKGGFMRRTNIEIDEEKLAQIKALTGATTIKDAVDLAFAELIRIDKQRSILSHRGMGGWDDDLDQMRGR